MILVGRRPKNRYEQMLSEYRKRKDNLKGLRNTISYRRYKERLKKYNNRISFMKLQIKLHNEKINFLKTLLGAVIKYFNDNPVKPLEESVRKPMLSRDMFFRYGLEHGMSGSLLTDFLGFSRKNSHYAPDCRRRAMNSQEKKDVYRSFCKFVFTLNGDKELEIKKRKKRVNVKKEEKR